MKQRSKKSIWKQLILLTVVVLTTTACGKTPVKQKPATLLIWKTYEDSENFRPLITAYQKAHPSTKITYVEKDPETYETDLVNALAAGNGPDIFSIHNAWLPRYTDKIVPVSDTAWRYVDYKDRFIDTVVQDFTINQKIYGVALAADSLALYYNKDILASNGIYTPPKTWAEFAKDVRTITRQNSVGYFTQSGAALGLSSSAPGGQINRAEDILYLMMLQRGVVPWASDGSRPQFQNSVEQRGNRVEAGSDALQFYTSFANSSNQNYTWNTKSDYSIDSFVNGRAAMMINYSYARDTIQKKASTLNYDVAPVPQINLDDPAVGFANYWGEVVSKQSEFPDAAWDFLKTVTTKDVLSQYYAVHKQPSSIKELIEFQTADPEIGVFAHANATAKSFYRPDQAKVDKIFAQMIDKVTLRGIKPQEALSQAASQAGTITVPKN